ncbi:hypothetical protein GGX14DRAFT_627353 [Mycena pura]|uniref:Uncharacterized protein n=1 Tax=Mycena pura TaxID=153505 RepID=A0AAD6YQV1_9AGAR|nr:hypothetical protein GGX14DRAFT_627353 [Mycena pura]
MPSDAPQLRRSKRRAEDETHASEHRRPKRLAEARDVTAPTPPSAAPTRTRSRTEKEPPLPDDIREMHALSRKLDEYSLLSQNWRPFLLKLQETLDQHQPGLFNIWPEPIKWLDKKEHTKLAKWLPGIEFDYVHTLRRWVDTDAGHGKQFSLAVMTTPPAYRVGKEGRADWSQGKWHMWVLLTAHAPEGSNGKTIIIYDTDVEEYNNTSREHTAFGYQYRYVQYIRKNKTSRARDRVWQNVPVPGGRPAKDDCFRFTMNWIQGLVAKITATHVAGAVYIVVGFAEICGINISKWST